MVLRLCKDKDLAERKWADIVLRSFKKTRGATQRNTQELRLLFENIKLFRKLYII